MAVCIGKSEQSGTTTKPFTPESCVCINYQDGVAAIVDDVMAEGSKLYDELRVPAAPTVTIVDTFIVGVGDWNEVE